MKNIKIFNTILVAVDGSEHSDRALKFAIKLSKQNDCRLYAIHVIDQKIIDNYKVLKRDKFELREDLIEKGQAISLDIKNSVENENINIQTLIKEGIPYQQIVETSKEIKADLIIVAHEGNKSAFTSHHVGSTTKHLIEYIETCPILIIN